MKYLYNNPRTGVTGEFAFHLDLLENPSKSKRMFNFPGFSETPLTFSMDLIRPTFFALELMPIIVELAQKFELYVFDPQSEIVRAPAIQHTDKLIESWDNKNRTLVNPILSNPDNTPLVCKRGFADEWWKYMYHLEDIREHNPIDVFIPEMLILRNSKSNSLFRAITWADFMPIAIPECDYIAMIETKGLYSSKFNDLGVYKFSDILNVFGQFIKKQMIFDRKFFIIDTEASEEFADEFMHKLKSVNSQKAKKFTAVESEDFLDFHVKSR